jgi:hypothetical protein
MHHLLLLIAFAGFLLGWNMSRLYKNYRNRKDMERIWEEIRREINEKAEPDIFEDRLN